jgi:hypothetical protein
MIIQGHPKTRRIVGKNQLVIHMDNSLCRNGRKIPEYFARKRVMIVSHPVYSPDLSLCDFVFFRCPSEGMKDQIIKNEDYLENKSAYV